MSRSKEVYLLVTYLLLVLYVDQGPKARILSHVVSLQCLSSLFLKEFVVSASTTAFGRLFQLFTTLCEKEFCLSNSLDRCLYNFLEFPRRFLDDAALKKIAGSILSFPLRILNVSIKSSLNLLCSNGYNFNFLSLSPYGKFFNLLTSLVARCCTFSRQWRSVAWAK